MTVKDKRIQFNDSIVDAQCTPEKVITKDSISGAVLMPETGGEVKSSVAGANLTPPQPPATDKK